MGDTLTGATAGPLDYTQFGGYEIAGDHDRRATSGGITAGVATPSRPCDAAGGGHLQRGEPGADRPAGQVRPARRQGIVHNLAVAGHRRGRGDPGQRRRHRRRRGRGRPDADQADRRDRRGGRPAVRLARDRPGQRRRTAASRAATSARSSSSTRSGCPLWTGRAATSTTAVTVLASSDGTAAAVASPRPHRPDQPGLDRQPQAAGRRVPVPGPGRSSWWPTTSWPSWPTSPTKAATSRPPQSRTTQRAAQATVLHDFVGRCSDDRPDGANVVVVGDLNDYQFSPTAAHR